MAFQALLQQYDRSCGLRSSGQMQQAREMLLQCLESVRTFAGGNSENSAEADDEMFQMRVEAESDGVQPPAVPPKLASAVTGAILIDLGVVFANTDEHGKMLETQTELLAIAQNDLADTSIELIALDRLTIAHNGLHDYAAALTVSSDGLKLSKEIGDRQKEAAFLTSMGNAYEGQRKYMKAVECVTEALEIFRDTVDDAEQHIENKREEGFALCLLSVGKLAIHMLPP